MLITLLMLMIMMMLNCVFMAMIMMMSLNEIANQEPSVVLNSHYKND